ncbi:MAG: lytic transglycosylase domain-containing protein [Nitrospirae bacterium]|nr:lytic transglycosylase domain-containing protein [Nitrospirota bacterium]
MAWCLSAHLLSPTVPYSHIITQISCRHHINPVLVAGIVAQESRFDPSKRRIEERIHDVSLGLMQITTRTARWMGLQGPITKLYDPVVNLTLGVRYLAWLLQKHPYGADAVAAYNAGRPRWRHGGYVNSQGAHTVERYVVRVISWARHFHLQSEREAQEMVALEKNQRKRGLGSLDNRLLAWFDWPPGTLYPDVGRLPH